MEFAATWRDLESLLLSEAARRDRDQHGDFSPVRGTRKRNRGNDCPKATEQRTGELEEFSRRRAAEGLGEGQGRDDVYNTLRASHARAHSPLTPTRWNHQPDFTDEGTSSPRGGLLLASDLVIWSPALRSCTARCSAPLLAVSPAHRVPPGSRSREAGPPTLHWAN